MGGGKEEPLCEVEVELKSGPIGATVGYAIALSVSYGLEVETKSKFKRAYDLARE